jgi:hypothetical protein
LRLGLVDTFFELLLLLMLLSLLRLLLAQLAPGAEMEAISDGGCRPGWCSSQALKITSRRPA